nr:hypothetical protein [Tanacetum cinerariifolium]
MAMNTMPLSINLKSQKQEVKNIIEHVTKGETRITESLKIFKIIHKLSSISNLPQISSVITITPDLPTEEREYSLSMGDEHLSTILKIKPDEVIKSSVKNLFPLPSEFEVTSDNEKEADLDLEEEILLLRICRMIIHLHDSRKNLMRKLLIRLSSLSPSPIRVEDSDSHMEEIDLFLAIDDLMPPGIE